MANYKPSQIELERINEWCKKERNRYENGLFVSSDEGIGGVLGYGTVLDFTVSFRDASEYAGPACLAIPPRSEILDSPVELPERSNNRYSFEKIVVPGRGLDFRMRVRADYLDDAPVQEPLRDFYGPQNFFVPAKDMKKIPEVEQLLEKYGVKKTGSFGWAEVHALLEGMKEFGYWWGKGPIADPPSEFIRQKKGVCGQFAQLFCHLVYGAGGICRVRKGPFLNLQSMGRDIYLMTGSAGDKHQWAEVCVDGRFQVIDPTFYINTSKGYWEDSKELWEKLAQRFINGCNHAYVLGIANLYLAKGNGQAFTQKISEVSDCK